MHTTKSPPELLSQITHPSAKLATLEADVKRQLSKLPRIGCNQKQLYIEGFLVSEEAESGKIGFWENKYIQICSLFANYQYNNTI